MAAALGMLPLAYGIGAGADMLRTAGHCGHRRVVHFSAAVARRDARGLLHFALRSRKLRRRNKIYRAPVSAKISRRRRNNLKLESISGQNIVDHGIAGLNGGAVPDLRLPWPVGAVIQSRLNRRTKTGDAMFFTFC